MSTQLRMEHRLHENDWPAAARRLEVVLRRLGLAAEDAFYAVALAYDSTSTFDSLESIAKRGARAHSLLAADLEGREIIEELTRSDPQADSMPVLYQHFVGTKFRRGSGMYFTPKSVAASMARLIPRQEGLRVLDPSCGGGTFLAEVSRYFEHLDCQLLANDVEPTLADLTRIRLAHLPIRRDYEVREANIYDSAALADWRGSIHAIIANPPFSLKISAPGFSSPLFDLGYNSSDALFLDLAHDLLLPGGRLVCLLPHSLFANADYFGFRELVQSRFVLRASIGLPEGIFYTTADTTTRAGIVVLDKISVDQSGEQDLKVLFGHASSVGVSLNSRDSYPKDSLADLVSSPANRRALGLDDQ